MKCKYKEMCGFDICTEEDCLKYKPAQETNGDVIRAMSDEALGAYLCFVINAYHKVCDKCPASSLCSSEGVGLIKWLGLPADPENE